MASRLLGWVKSFTRWLFGAPVSSLPPAFGDTVPAHLRVFEAEADEIMEHEVEVKRPLSQPAQRSKGVVFDRWLQRV